MLVGLGEDRREMPHDGTTKTWPTLDELVELAREAATIVREKFIRGASILGGRGHLVTEADVLSEEHVMRAIRERHVGHLIVAEESAATPPPPPHPGAPPIPTWVIDPLDGTRNFAAGLPHFAISIGFGLFDARGYRPLVGAIVHPVTGDVWAAADGEGAFFNGERIDPTRPRRSNADGALAVDIGKIGGMSGVLRLARVALGPARRARVARMPGSAALELAMTARGHYAAFYGHGLSPWDVAAGVLIITEAGGAVCARDGSPYDVLRGGPFFAGGRAALTELTR
jgi:myo-inositol-1(or 4)-monophosphatase